MEKITIKKIIAGVAILGTMIGGTFIVSRDMQETEINEMRTNLIEKSGNGTLTYDEYRQLIREYNQEIKETKEAGKVYKLENLNKDNSILKRSNEKLIGVEAVAEIMNK